MVVSSDDGVVETRDFMGYISDTGAGCFIDLEKEENELKLKEGETVTMVFHL